ncbi:hypothetical protein RP726_02850 [Candidatus Methylospira mobilis]|uniref:hypothetical protein n=1 Tax=Candidatus Methylospira mobilis TaxID=1808979 RepID=UPI0028E4294D|nr:hypothetical protein [Candidatus Methylospira mobilis]WNV05360.1 hypothetical protein RP726_02850 [Candidatus Methylospira mobilis]
MFIRDRLAPLIAKGARPWIGFIWLYLFTLLWHFMAGGSVTAIAAAWLLSLLLGGLLCGDIFLNWALRDNQKFNNLPAKLVAGLLLTNICLYFMIWVLPCGLTANWLLFLGAILILWCFARPTRTDMLLPAGNGPELYFMLAAPLAVTAWCQDILHPIVIDAEGRATFHAWQDVPFHLSQISTFTASGFGPTAQAYHMTSYLLPATLVYTTGSSLLVSYASLLLPLGILISFLAAYALTRSIFGQWPALAASLALMVLPDASQQGFINAFLGYHWLQQVAPASAYGVAGAAFAFMLLLEACRTNQFRLICWGYAFVVVTLLYKAQIFVAISWLAFVFPALFIAGIARKYRLLLVLLLSAVFTGVIAASQSIPSVPTIKLDGSSLMPYSSFILSSMENGFIKHLFTSIFDSSENNVYLRAAAFILMLMICTFGAFSIIYAALVGQMKRCFTTAIWMFPLLVVAVYLVMACFLAFDGRGIGKPEELLHRHFVWAYFTLVIWCGAAVYRLIFGNAPPAGNQVKYILSMLVLFSAITPVSYGRGMQAMKNWGMNYPEFPACQVNAALYIRDHSAKDDVAQDSMNDHFLILSTLSGRQPFAVDAGGSRAPLGIQSRLRQLRQLSDLQYGGDAEFFMKTNAIKWYILNPGEHPRWASAMQQHAVFECEGYRVYHF